MGVVFVVHDLKSPSVYAVKTFRDEVFARNPTVALRFTQEALAWANLGNHQNIVRAHYVLNIGYKPYLFLDYIAGGDLQSRIGTASFTSDLPQIVYIGLQFCDGMTYAASKGIKAHRDIKPQNCLVTPDGILKITDFGLAKVYDDIGLAPSDTLTIEGLSVTRTGLGMGTSTHMAPEQFADAKHVDARADIYSFGVMLFQMITGRLPFRGRSWQEYKHLHTTQRPPSLGTPHAELNTIVQRCLSKDPAQRFADFAVVRERLAAIYTKLTGQSAPWPVTGTELDANDWFNKGLSLNELGRPLDAIACYDRALELNPGLEDAICLNKGNPLAKLGRHEEAAVCYDRALALNPNRAEAWLGKGNRLAALARHQEAIACYERALSIKPQLYQALNGIGMALGSQGEDGKAVRCFDKAIALNQLDEISWVNKAAALSAMGKRDAAVACCDQALKLIPDSLQVWTKKAHLLGAAGDRVEEALACYDRATELHPQSAETWMGKGLLFFLHLQNLDRALDCFEQAHKLGDPRAADFVMRLKSAQKARIGVGYTVQLPNNPDDRRKESGRGLAERMDEQTCLSLALVHLLQGRRASEFVKAQAMAEKAIEIASQWPDSWVSKGIRLNAYSWFLYDPQAALSILGGPEQASKLLGSNGIEGHFITGIGSLCGRRYGEALEAFKAAARLEQNNPFINVCIAVVLIEQAAPDASSVIEHCSRLHKGHPLLSLIRFDRAA
jgi:tetratricopeptide (TPR) repeat protein